MSTPQIIIVGNLASDPETGTTQSGKSYARIAVMSSNRVKDQSGNWSDGDRSTKRCTAWNDLADHIGQSLHKGDQVIVIGHEHDTSWQDKQSGQTRYGTDVLVSEIGASLRYAVASPQRVQRGQSQQTGYAAPGLDEKAAAAPQYRNPADPWQGAADPGFDNVSF
jgi:single-strand DNA-binding protein